MLYIFIGFLVFSLFLAIFLIYKFGNKKRSLNKKNFLLQKKYILNNKVSSKEKIIDLDKLYHSILKELGYSGTFGEILKLKPKEISDINKIWELHKLRNKLVHDFDLISESSLNKKVFEYSEEINKLLD